MKNTFDDLPFAIVLATFSLLDSHTACRSARVCKNWSKILAEKQLIGVAFLRERLLACHRVALPDSIIYQIFKLKKRNVADSLEMLADYAHFRKTEFGRFSDPDIALRNEAAKKVAFFMSVDKFGRPCILVRPRLHFVQKKNATLLYALQLFERACDIVFRTRGVEDVVVIVDFEGFGSKNFDLSFVRTFISWARKYYKNLLGSAYCIRSPSYALWCWTLIKIFIPAATLKKVHILKNHDWKPFLLKQFATDELPRVYGGSSSKLDQDIQP